MGLVGGRLMFFLAALVLALGWGIGNGYVKWEQDSYKCWGVGFYKSLPRQRLVTVGRLHIYYQPYAWGCDTDHRYDPTKYKLLNGELVPKDYTSTTVPN